MQDAARKRQGLVAEAEVDRGGRICKRKRLRDAGPVVKGAADDRGGIIQCDDAGVVLLGDEDAGIVDVLVVPGQVGRQGDATVGLERCGAREGGVADGEHAIGLDGEGAGDDAGHQGADAVGGDLDGPRECGARPDDGLAVDPGARCEYAGEVGGHVAADRQCARAVGVADEHACERGVLVDFGGAFDVCVLDVELRLDAAPVLLGEFDLGAVAHGQAAEPDLAGRPSFVDGRGVAGACSQFGVAVGAVVSDGDEREVLDGLDVLLGDVSAQEAVVGDLDLRGRLDGVSAFAVGAELELAARPGGDLGVGIGVVAGDVDESAADIGVALGPQFHGAARPADGEGSAVQMQAGDADDVAALVVDVHVGRAQYGEVERGVAAAVAVDGQDGRCGGVGFDGDGDAAVDDGLGVTVDEVEVRADACFVAALQLCLGIDVGLDVGEPGEAHACAVVAAFGPEAAVDGGGVGVTLGDDNAIVLVDVGAGVRLVDVEAYHVGVVHFDVVSACAPTVVAEEVGGVFALAVVEAHLAAVAGLSARPHELDGAVAGGRCAGRRVAHEHLVDVLYLDASVDDSEVAAGLDAESLFEPRFLVVADEFDVGAGVDDAVQMELLRGEQLEDLVSARPLTRVAPHVADVVVVAVVAVLEVGGADSVCGRFLVGVAQDGDVGDADAAPVLVE